MVRSAIKISESRCGNIAIIEKVASYEYTLEE